VRHTPLIIAFLFFKTIGFAQSAWPSISWGNATNLSSIIDSNGVNELSGLHWNPVKNQLFAVGDYGNLIVLLEVTGTNTFSFVANKTIAGGPEGITQANFNDNEFYVIDENNYQIDKYTYTANFSTVDLIKHWDLLLPPSTMNNTGNTGTEGIVFIPDSNLSTIGFVSQQTGNLYTSTKGAGGLFFIANQNGGYIWVFDINPNVNDDFAFVGKYKTNATESCDLSFDRSNNILYILHNVSGNNSLETTTLSTTITSGTQRKFVTLNQYTIPTPVGNNDNIEGFAMTPKCLQSENGNVKVWLCRDVASSESTSLLQDAIREFSPFLADGNCQPLAVSLENKKRFSIYPNPAQKNIVIESLEHIKVHAVQIMNYLGQVLLYQETNTNDVINLDISNLSTESYLLKVATDMGVFNYKFIKN
jgi:hypothetical protein